MGLPDEEVFEKGMVRNAINKFEKMGYNIEGELKSANEVLDNLKKHKKILEARKEKYKTIRDNSKGLKKQIEDLKGYCKKYIDSIDWYIDELKKRGIKEDINNLKKLKENAQHRITEIMEMENERHIKKYGTNLDKILTLKSCNSAIEDINSIIEELNKAKKEVKTPKEAVKKAIEKSEKAIKEYSLILWRSKKYLPLDTKEYEEFYKKINNYTNEFDSSLKSLEQNIEEFRNSSEKDGWISSIKSQINSINKSYIIEKVLGGIISSMTGIILNYVVIPGIIYAYGACSNSR